MEKLVITEQTSLLEEKFSKNGVQKNVHVVVKNNPFIVTLVVLDKHINFNQVATDIQLVYDCASLKEVDFVKLKPMDFKVKCNEEGDQLTVELRIKVLTSQLEDMFFRVKIALVDPHTQKEIPHCMVLTHPIRVVSKPDQVKKKIKKRKRAPTDNLMDTLNRIEVQQKEQQRLLKRLCVADTRDGSASGMRPLQTESAHDVPVDAFHTAFVEFLAAFKQMTSVEDCSYKVNTSAQDAQIMCEILDLVRIELKKAGHSHTPDDYPPHPAQSASIPCAEPGHCPQVCSCASCPYRDCAKAAPPPIFPIVPEEALDNTCEISLNQCMQLPNPLVHGDTVGQMAQFNFGSFSDISSLFAVQ